MCNLVNIACFMAALTLGTVMALPKQGNPETDLVNMINQIDNEVTLPLFGGLRIDRIDRQSRSYENSYKTIESFDERAERYLETHQLNFSFPDDGEDSGDAQQESSGRSLEEARGKKMKKMLVPLLLLLKLKKAVIVKVLLSVIKFISFKSLAISLVALFFAAATFFKDLLSKKKDHITTAYITGSPLNAEIVHSDWNRNGPAAAADLAYNHYGLAQPF